MDQDFLQSLNELLSARGENIKTSLIGGKQINLYQLYMAVIQKGGFQQVSNSKQWKSVLQHLQLDSSGAFTVQKVYQKYLLPYQRVYFFKKTDHDFPQTTFDPTSQNGTRKIKISCKYLQNTRRMILAFDTHQQSEVNWALNSLLLLSCNTVHNYQIQSNGLPQSMVGYLNFLQSQLPEFKLPLKRKMKYFVYSQHLKTLLAILRNLSMIRNNEIILYKTEGFTQIIVKIFARLQDEEIVQPSMEILCNLSRHIFLTDIENPYSFLTGLVNCMQSKYSELAIECFRKLTLPLSNQEIIQTLPQVFYDELAKWLESYTKTKEAVLEILCCLSDQNYKTRMKIAQAPGCLEALVKHLTSSSQGDDTEDKPAKISAIILSNLAVTPHISGLLRPFSTQIFVAAASDQRIGGLLSTVLFEASRQNKIFLGKFRFQGVKI